MDVENQTRQAIMTASEQLFSQHGWQRISIGDICAEAKVSRVSFYRYFKNKIELLKEIILSKQKKVRDHHEQVLREVKTLEEVINAIFEFQDIALKQFFTTPVLKDFDNNKNLELQSFLENLREEKYVFLNYFFEELQNKKIIHANYPTELIYNYLKAMDDLILCENIQNIYKGKNNQLRKDTLKLIMFGLSGPK